MTVFIAKITAFFMALISTVVPFVNYDAQNKDELLFNAAIISDIHIDATLPVGKLMLSLGLNDVKRNAAKNNAVIIPGDLTNYGDKESVEVFYEILSEVNPADNWVVAPGNHDIGHAECSNEEARQSIIEINNRYTGEENENIYYTKVVDGYRFIVLCDESEDNWDGCDISDEQIEFLDKYLKRGTKRGKPVFVICHWPLEYTNGQQAIYEEGAALEGEFGEKVRAVLEKYKNVFFISGHMHKGVNGEIFQDVFGFSSVETFGGVTYVNLPSYGIANRYGIPWNGIGMQMEVYENEVVFRPRRYLYSKWYGFIEYRVPIVK